MTSHIKLSSARNLARTSTIPAVRMRILSKMTVSCPYPGGKLDRMSKPGARRAYDVPDAVIYLGKYLEVNTSRRPISIVTVQGSAVAFRKECSSSALRAVQEAYHTSMEHPE